MCGTGVGPEIWRDGQLRQAELRDQTREMACAIDELGMRVRRRLGEQLKRHILPALSGVFSDYYDRVSLASEYDPDDHHNLDLSFDLHEAVAKLGPILEDPTLHPTEVIKEAKAMLSEIKWPEISDDARNRVTSFFKEVIRLPWATPQKGDTPFLLSLATGSLKEVEVWRELRMLPAIAQRERRPMLNALRYYLEAVSRRDAKGQTYCRYLVITSGGRLPYGGDLRRRIEGLQRLISRWAVISRDIHGVHVIYRGTEMTLEATGAHVHANVVVEPENFMGERAWADYQAAMRRHFGTWVRDNGRVKDPKEIVKYVCKPTQLKRYIFDHSDENERFDRIEWIYRALYKTRLVAPLGAMRELWQQIEEDKLKPCSVKNQIRLVPKFEPGPRSKEKKPLGENVILSQMLSNRIHTPWAEPSVLIFGYTEQPTTKAGERNLERLNELRAEALDAWNANKAPAPKTATAIARAWLEAETAGEAGKVWAIGGSGATAANHSPPAAGGGIRGGVSREAGSIVHNSGVTVRDREADPPTKYPGGAPPGLVWESGCLIDPQTGEIFEDRGRDAA